jgi:hypothetical protein
MVSAALEEHVSPSVRHAPVYPDRPPFRRLSEAELSTLYDPSLIAAAFETSEIAIDPWAVATALRRALRAHPRIELRMSTRVIRVHERGDRSFDVLCENDNAQRIGPFDGVVNALWTNRHAIDQRSGIATGPTSFTRRKLGVSLCQVQPSYSAPSATSSVIRADVSTSRGIRTA